MEGHWCYLYRAIDRSGALVDVMFSEHRDMAAAKAFCRAAKMVTGATPDRITTDGHDSYPRAIRTELSKDVRHRINAYLNNRLEQDHRAIKRLMRPMLGFKSFRSAAVTLVGIEPMHMIRKGQLRTTGEMCPARQFYSLAG